ncbi:MAG: GerMN domain-containing protein [Acidimicrobiales bacterium]
MSAQGRPSRNPQGARGALRLAALALVGALAAGGCDLLPEDGSAQEITPETTSTTALARPGERDQELDPCKSVAVWLWDDKADRLVESRRETPLLSAESAIRELVSGGPTEPDRRKGLISAIPAGTRVQRVTRQAGGDVAVIDLNNPPFGGLTGDTLAVAVAQLVFTATEPAPGERPFGKVRFTFDDKVKAVATADDTSKEEVTREDYGRFGPAGLASAPADCSITALPPPASTGSAPR